MMVKLPWNGSSLSSAAKPGGHVQLASKPPAARPIRPNHGLRKTSSGDASSHTSNRPTWLRHRDSNTLCDHGPLLARTALVRLHAPAARSAEFSLGSGGKTLPPCHAPLVGIAFNNVIISQGVFTHWLRFSSVGVGRRLKALKRQMQIEKFSPAQLRVATFSSPSLKFCPQ